MEPLPRPLLLLNTVDTYPGASLAPPRIWLSARVSQAHDEITMPQLGEGREVVSPMYVAKWPPDSSNSTLEETSERHFITLLRRLSANHPKVVLGAPKLLFKAGRADIA